MDLFAALKNLAKVILHQIICCRCLRKFLPNVHVAELWKISFFYNWIYLKILHLTMHERYIEEELKIPGFASHNFWLLNISKLKNLTFLNWIKEWRRQSSNSVLVIIKGETMVFFIKMLKSTLQKFLSFL